MSSVVAERLRVVIVNYNGGALLQRAVGSVAAAEWLGPIDVVIVDNASTDESLAQVESLPGVHVIRRPTNEGFGANNHGFADLLDEPFELDLPEPEFVLLLNPDAMIRPDVPAKLAEELDTRRRVGAVAPHIVFDRPFIELSISGEATITSIELDGEAVSARCHALGGTFRIPGRRGPLWVTNGRGAVRVPMARAGSKIVVETARNSEGEIAGQTVDGSSIEIDAFGLPTVLVVQNAGSEVDGKGVGHNRGFTDVDGARRYPHAVHAWCGAAVLFHADYLRAVGGFEPSYFLYYEDIDLSLRGEELGWSTVYVHDAVVEHRHSDRTVQGTALVEVLQQRNRLRTIRRHGSPLDIAKAYVRALLTPASLFATALRNRSLAPAYLRLAWWRLKALRP